MTYKNMNNLQMINTVNKNEEDIVNLSSQMEEMKNLIVNVKDFGALGDGVTDDTLAIQKSIDYAENIIVSRVKDGATILFPVGTYVVQSFLKVKKSGVFLKGESITTSIHHKGLLTELLIFEGDIAIYRSGMKDFTITSDLMEDKKLIKISNMINSMFSNMIISNSYDCFTINKAGKVYFDNIIFTQDSISSKSRYAFDITGGNDVHFSNIQIFTNATPKLSSCMIIRSCDGLYFSNSHWHGTVLILPMPTDTLASIFFDNCYFDRGDGSCISFQGKTSNPYRNFMFTNCYFRDASNGVEIITTGIVELIQFTGCSFTQNRLNGVKINTIAENILFSGCSFADNNVGKDTNSGHLLNSGNNVKVSNCQFVRGSDGGFGIKSTGSNCDISNNNLKNCNGDKLVVQGSQNNVVNNSGVITVKRGSVTIPTGLTEIIVEHGLTGINSEMIMVIPRSLISTCFRIAWVNDYSFRILINSPEKNSTIFTYWIDSNIYR